MRVNLGCGSDRRDGWTGLDRAAGPAVDIVHDLDQGPWPFKDGSVEAILAKDVFEHVADPILFMTECWRVLQPEGSLFIRTPHWRHRDAYTDPTHRRFPTESTFDYWIPGQLLHHLHNAAYGGVSFKLDGLDVISGAINVSLFKLSNENSARLASEFADRLKGVGITS